MAIGELLQACAGKGYKVDTAAGTASGVQEGIAFRADPAAGTLEMSVNVPENHLPKLQSRLESLSYRGATAVHHHFGILVTVPGAADLPPDRYLRLIEDATREAAKLIGVAYDDKFERGDREPFSAYLRGILGALLGAVVGVLPWFGASILLNWQFGWLAFLVSTGAFVGYTRLCGAHRTGFATAVIVISSLAAMYLSNLAEVCVSVYRLAEELPMETVWAFLQQGGAVSPAVWQNMLFGVVFAAIGLAAVRSRVLTYTHEPWFLRRPKNRK